MLVRDGVEHLNNAWNCAKAQIHANRYVLFDLSCICVVLDIPRAL